MVETPSPRKPRKDGLHLCLHSIMNAYINRSTSVPPPTRTAYIEYFNTFLRVNINIKLLQRICKAIIETSRRGTSRFTTSKYQVCDLISLTLSSLLQNTTRTISCSLFHASVEPSIKKLTSDSDCINTLL